VVIILVVFIMSASSIKSAATVCERKAQGFWHSLQRQRTCRSQAHRPVSKSIELWNSPNLASLLRSISIRVHEALSSTGSPAILGPSRRVVGVTKEARTRGFTSLAYARFAFLG
jgi:hypothetical protein